MQKYNNRLGEIASNAKDYSILPFKELRKFESIRKEMFRTASSYSDLDLKVLSHTTPPKIISNTKVIKSILDEIIDEAKTISLKNCHYWV